jgi:integral membrane sensor domain MASE1
VGGRDAVHHLPPAHVVWLVGAAVVVGEFGGEYWSAWCVWWMSGALGVLLVVPVVVNFVVI